MKLIFAGSYKTNAILAAPGALAHRLQRRTARLIQNGRRGLEIQGVPRNLTHFVFGLL